MIPVIMSEKVSGSELSLDPNEYVTMDCGLKDLEGHVIAVIWLFSQTGCGHQCLSG